MNYSHLLKILAASTEDSWCLIECPGPTVQVCSHGLRNRLLAVHRPGLADDEDEQRSHLLISAFKSVWTGANADQNQPLSVPLGCLDHVRIVPLNDAHEPDAFLLFFLQLDRDTRDPDDEPAAALLETLSPRQAEILNAVYAGETNKSIGRRLGISQKTVEKHRAKVMERLDVGSVVELVRMITVLKLDSKTDNELVAATLRFPTNSPTA